MAFVVVAEEHRKGELLGRLLGRLLVLVVDLDLGELGADQVRHPELFPDPERHRLEERGEAARRIVEIGLEQAVELEERLVVEADVIELRRPNTGLGETVPGGSEREAVVVLLAGEALLLRGGDDLSVHHQAGRRVVVEGGDPQDPGHGRPFPSSSRGELENSV